MARARIALFLMLIAAIVSIPDVASAGAIKISQIYFDPPGTDTRTNSQLRKEYVVVTNTGDRARSLTGWVLRDAAGHRFVFPQFRLRPGRIVRIRTGSGSNDGNDLFWGMGNYVWNNDGDTAYLKKPSGRTVSTCSYGSGESSPKTC